MKTLTQKQIAEKMSSYRIFENSSLRVSSSQYWLPDTQWMRRTFFPLLQQRIQDAPTHCNRVTRLLRIGIGMTVGCSRSNGEVAIGRICYITKVPVNESPANCYDEGFLVLYADDEEAYLMSPETGSATFIGHLNPKTFHPLWAEI